MSTATKRTSDSDIIFQMFSLLFLDEDCVNMPAAAILIIKDFDIAGIPWYANKLLKSEMYDKGDASVEAVDYEYNTNPLKHNVIVQMIRTRRYPGTIIADLSGETYFESFKPHFGEVLKKYVNQGGRIAFPSCEGHLLMDVLTVFFDVPWETAEYATSNYTAPAGLVSSSRICNNEYWSRRSVYNEILVLAVYVKLLRGAYIKTLQ